MKWTSRQQKFGYHGLDVYADSQVEYIAVNMHGFMFGYFEKPVISDSDSYWVSTSDDINDMVALGRVDLDGLNWRESLMEYF